MSSYSCVHYRKEAYGSKQMTQVSSILHNRLNDTTGHYKYLACDATTSYIPDIETGLLTNTEIEAFSLKYNTYLSSGLPIILYVTPVLVR